MDANDFNNLVALLEPGAKVALLESTPNGMDASIAISLKRIADALEHLQERAAYLNKLMARPQR